MAPVSNLRTGLLELDLEKQRAFDLRAANGSSPTQTQNKELDLTPVEFRLLLLFMRESGSIVPRETILSQVWGDQIHVSPRVVVSAGARQSVERLSLLRS